MSFDDPQEPAKNTPLLEKANVVAPWEYVGSSWTTLFGTFERVINGKDALMAPYSSMVQSNNWVISRQHNVLHTLPRRMDHNI